MTAFTISSDSFFLLALLNSKPIWFYLSRFAAVLGDADERGRVRAKTQYISGIPIPTATESQQAEIGRLAEACQEAAKAGDDARLQALEAEIDQIVYRLFDLTPEEIALIEKPTR